MEEVSLVVEEKGEEVEVEEEVPEGVPEEGARRGAGGRVLVGGITFFEIYTND